MVELHHGPRAEVQPLFELAEDSPDELATYRDLGRLMVARAGGVIVGHLQLVATERPDAFEVKNMAVVERHRGQGVGSRLMAAALDLAAADGASRLVVATAAADVGNLRFYQRLGFRMLAVERDAFGPGNGYPAGLSIDGIELRDRVWLDRPVPQNAVQPPSTEST